MAAILNSLNGPQLPHFFNDFDQTGIEIHGLQSSIL